MKRHFMIDLETMGLQPNCAIVSIGATLFDQNTIVSTFYSNASLQSCLDIGLTTDQSTIDWWATQPAEIRAAWQREDAPHIGEALRDLQNWMLSYGTSNELCPWGNGADFDLVVLKSAYQALDADPPWKYWNHHCFRTLKNLFPIGKMPRTGAHNALEDAKYQTDMLHRILTVHNLTLPA